MKENKLNCGAADWLALNPDMLEAIQRDASMTTAAVQSMAGAIARLPRTMSWSVQPAVIMQVSRLPPERLIDRTKGIF